MEHNKVRTPWEISEFNYKEDWLDMFLENYISSEEFEDLRCVFKIVSVPYHGQSAKERGFSMNKEILQEHLHLPMADLRYFSLFQHPATDIHHFTDAQ